MSVETERLPGRTGRPPRCPREVVIRILTLLDQGHSLQDVADLFNLENIPTPAGGSRWYKEMVDRTAKTLHARKIAAELIGALRYRKSKVALDEYREHQ